MCPNCGREHTTSGCPQRVQAGPIGMSPETLEAITRNYNPTVEGLLKQILEELRTISRRMVSWK